MEECKSCDHNVRIECEGGCFFPHKAPPCFQKAVESQTTVVQQLKAEIAALCNSFIKGRRDLFLDEFVSKYERLRQLSAV